MVDDRGAEVEHRVENEQRRAQRADGRSAHGYEDRPHQRETEADVVQGSQAGGDVGRAEPPC